MRKGKWQVGSGKWEVARGKWQVRNGKWEMASGNSGEWEVGPVESGK